MSIKPRGRPSAIVPRRRELAINEGTTTARLAVRRVVPEAQATVGGVLAPRHPGSAGVIEARVQQRLTTTIRVGELAPREAELDAGKSTLSFRRSGGVVQLLPLVWGLTCGCALSLLGRRAAPRPLVDRLPAPASPATPAPTPAAASATAT